MKKLFVFFALFIMCATVFAQATTTEPAKTIVVNESDLTTDQLVKIKTEAAQKALEGKLETYGKWVGVGGEIGQAIKDGLNAVVDVADKFGNTRVGNFTMVLVAWKIIGKDLVRILVGLLFIFVVSLLIFRNYRNSFTEHRICIEDNGWKFWLPKKYQVVKPNSEYDGYEFVKILHIILLAGAFGLTYAIMFA
jgi:hypothetical protein